MAADAPPQGSPPHTLEPEDRARLCRWIDVAGEKVVRSTIGLSRDAIAMAVAGFPIRRATVIRIVERLDSLELYPFPG